MPVAGGVRPLRIRQALTWERCDDTGWVYEAHEHQVSDGRGLAWRRATGEHAPICGNAPYLLIWLGLRSIEGTAYMYA
jgi:hypothetical protein